MGRGLPFEGDADRDACALVLWSRVRPLVARRPPERSAILARWD